MSSVRSYYEPYLQQHLEEVGDFRGRYRRLLRTQSVPWQRLVKWEGRHQLHLEALRHSRESSLKLARALMESEWEEDVFGGAATFLACGEAAPVLAALAETVSGPRRASLLDALFWTREGGVAHWIWNLVESSSDLELRADLLLLLGRRREYVPAILQRALQDEHPAVRTASLLTGAWLAPALIKPLLSHALSMPAIEQAAHLALLEIDPRRGIHLARNCIRAGRHVEALLPALAAKGALEDFDLLQGLLGGPHEPLALLAMGFHGSPKALSALAVQLEQGTSRCSLTAALDAYALISGWEMDMALRTEPEEDVSDDAEELEAEEVADRQERDARREQLRAHALEHWQSIQRRNFSGRRLRHGVPWSLSLCLRDLELLGGTPRAWTFREIALHTGHPALADPESFHAQQLKALRHWARNVGWD